MNALLLALAMAAAAPAAEVPKTPYTIDGATWTDVGNALPHPRLANIGIPRAAGGQTLRELGEFSDGSGLDNVAQYQSADGEVFATVYIYMPTLPDAGLAAIATDEIIRARFGPQTRRSEDAVVDAGKRKGVARWLVYDGASDGKSASVAAFVRAGRWLVKLRVTGPTERRAEVIADARAILAGLRFDSTAPPVAPRHYAVSECTNEQFYPPATALPRSAGDAGVALANTLGYSILSSLHVGGDLPVARDTATPEYCVIGRKALGSGIILVALGDRKAPNEPVLVLAGDSGRVFQLVASGTGDGGKEQPQLLFHAIGSALVYGPFDHAPTMDQYFGLFDNQAEWIGAPRAELKADPVSGTNISLLAPPPAKEPQIK